MLRRLAHSLAALALLLAIACGGEDEPAPAAPAAPAPRDVAESIRDVVAAIGARDVDTVMRHVALEFHGGYAGREAKLAYADVQAIAFEFLLREHPLSARVESLRVDDADASGTRRAEAQVWFDASLALADAASALPASAVGYRFELWFERHEGTWQAVRGTYARLDAPGAPSSGG